MIRQRNFAVAALALGLATPASAQDVPLSQLLLQFFSDSNPIILTGGFHEGHFRTQPEAQSTLGLLNTNIAAQLTSFPLGSSSGGFTFTLDPTLGVLSRNAISFGPLFAERAITSGKNKFTVGVSYQQNIFERLEGLNLREGDIHLTLFHEDVAPADGSNLNPFFEGDIIDSSLSLRLETNTRVFYANYGISDRFDVGVVVPWVSVNIDSTITATINDVSSDPIPIHRYADGTKTNLYTENGVAEGIGDVVLRAKFVAVQQDNFGAAFAADVRLPTGDEAELLGAGTTQAKLFAILSGSPKAKFNPHLNLGYTITGTSDVFGSLPDELNYTVGFDAAPTARFTVFADVIGRTLIDADRLVSEPRQLQYRTFNDPTVRTLDTTRLVSETGNLTLLLGSAGFKFNIVSRLLLSASALFSLTRDDGLQDEITPVISLDYTF
jgi:hypothetical protein